MGSKYDTGKIRELARQIGHVAEHVADIRSRTENAIRQEIPDNFNGSAASALSDTLSEWGGDVRNISNGLTQLKNTLYALARHLDEIDANARAVIGNR
ncbi:MAG: WXG100 family type VII secretion target [Oscillospiraceae bacterium]|nr:WXG100 family type VII secretion target [Oscillospiraceae bacterium]